jgi:hypothetical protein
MCAWHDEDADRGAAYLAGPSRSVGRGGAMATSYQIIRHTQLIFSFLYNILSP